MKISSIKPAFALLAFAMFSVRTVHADFLTDLSVIVTMAPGDGYQYSYTLTNLPSSDMNAFLLDINVSINAPLKSITGPDGWQVSYTVGDSAISWASLSSATDLIPGNSLNFSFDSTLGPGLQNDLILGTDESVGLGSNQGMIAAPSTSSVPEPASWLLLALSLPALYRLRRPLLECTSGV